LGNAGVTLAGEADLTAGDVIGLYYAANGLTLTLSIGLGAVNGVMWVVQRLT
jgi:collagen type VII alpha